MEIAKNDKLTKLKLISESGEEFEIDKFVLLQAEDNEDSVKTEIIISNFNSLEVAYCVKHLFTISPEAYQAFMMLELREALERQKEEEKDASQAD